MKIAILGWGSLLWDLETLTGHVDPNWCRGAGPVLPLEFSRISPKRKRALALIIDPEHGTDCNTSLVISRKNRLEEAVYDLAARERAPLERVGYASIHGDWQSSVAHLAPHLEAWLSASEFDAAVWADLPSNFEDEYGVSFSLSAAIGYLQSLDIEALQEAKRYIEFAPEETMTALRKLLEQNEWWAGISLVQERQCALKF